MKFPTKSHLTSLGLLVNSPKRVALVQVWQGWWLAQEAAVQWHDPTALGSWTCWMAPWNPSTGHPTWGDGKSGFQKASRVETFGIFTEFSRKPCLMTPESSSIFHGKIVWTCLFLRVNLHSSTLGGVFWYILKGIIQGDFLIFMENKLQRNHELILKSFSQCQVSLSRGYTSKKYPQHVRYTPQVLHYIHFHMVFQGCLRVSLGFM